MAAVTHGLFKNSLSARGDNGVPCVVFVETVVGPQSKKSVVPEIAIKACKTARETFIEVAKKKEAEQEPTLQLLQQFQEMALQKIYQFLEQGGAGRLARRWRRPRRQQARQTLLGVVARGDKTCHLRPPPPA